MVAGQPETHARKALLIAVGAVVALAVLFVIAQGLGQGGRDETGALVACHDFVSRRLVAPASASFAGPNDTTITGGGDHGEGVYTVTSSVDSQNGFGALLRTRFICQVQYAPSSKDWSLVGLAMP